MKSTTVILLNLFLVVVCAQFLFGQDTPSQPTAQIDRTSKARLGDAVLIRVMMDSGQSYVGEVLDEQNGALKILDLNSGKQRTLATASIVRSTKDISDSKAAEHVGLPAIIAWKIKKLAAAAPIKARIAKITPTVVYITAGSKRNIKQGQILNVFRVVGDIVDPTTGKLIDKERSRIAELEVVEVTEAYSKARLVGDLELHLQVGDDVQTIPFKPLIAVLPLVNVQGEETDEGIALAEDLITELVSKKIPVIEHTVLHGAIDRYFPDSLWTGTVPVR